MGPMRHAPRSGPARVPLWPRAARFGVVFARGRVRAEAVARRAIEDKANAPTLRKLAPASELGRLRAQLLEEMRVQREAYYIP
jgi:hypothetical protein